LTRLTNHPAEDADPAWSPNGKYLAFRTDRDGNPEVYTMRADGTGLTRLTNHPAFDGQPDWQ
jgi:TolB protein